MVFGMFSTLPLPKNVWLEESLCLMMPLFPFVGLAIGLLWYGVAWLLTVLSVNTVLSGGILALLPLLLSGFIHVDGFMDTSDAICSRAPLEKKRTILKDSHVGAFAVISFCVLLLLQFCAVYSVCSAQAPAFSTKMMLPFLFIPIVSRTVSGMVMLHTRLISQAGFAASFRRDGGHWQSVSLVCIFLLCLLAAFWFGGIMAGLVIIAVSVFGLIAAMYGIKQLDGISGDVCGYLLTIAECGGLLFWALVI